MELANLKSYDPHILGRQLQQARQRRGLTQEEAAQLINASRTTMVAIEQGERRIRAQELTTLSKAYGVSISDLLVDRPDVESFEVQFRSLFRKASSDTEKIFSSIDDLRELCRDYLELERLMDAPLPRRYPPEYRVEGLPVGLTAERVATEERQRLGLGDGPLGRIREIFENEVGIRVFYIPIRPSTYSEIYHYDELLGACMAINIMHPPQRRRWSLVHAYAHFVAHRYKASASSVERYRRKPESERFADDFATFFLMPTSSIVRRATEIKSSSKRFNVGHIFLLANYFGVSAQAMCLRLEELELLPNATWERLKDKGLKVREIEEELGIKQDTKQEDCLPKYYMHLAIAALDQGQITEGRFARYMRLDRVRAKAKAIELREELSGASGLEFGNMDLSK